MSSYEKVEQVCGRIRGKVTDIDYDHTLRFFKKRAEKYSEENPYAVTMYQDHNAELVQKRNRREMEVILPLLVLDGESKVLDIACGIGRWYDAIGQEIGEYCGVDFSEDLVRIARTRHEHTKHVDFITGSATELERVLEKNGKGKYNRILMMGILMYLNDSDIRNMMNQIDHVAGKDTIVCVREPLGIKRRLTLKDFYSEELENEYNAVYRTREELMNIFRDTLIQDGFYLKSEGWMFGDSLNNRKETAQYYFIFQRDRDND